MTESADESGSHWPVPDSKSSLRYVPAARPTPARETVCGAPAASSAIERVAARGPAADGEKGTFATHEAPAAREPPQSSLSAKSDAAGPTTVTPPTASGEPPLFLMVTLCGAPAGPTEPVTKDRLPGD